MISNEILSKYNMKPIETYKEIFGDTLETELTFYQTFLIQTDHIPNKITEELMEELVDVTIVNFIETFIKFAVKIRTEYKEVLQARKSCRVKVNEIEEAIKVS